MFSATTHEPSSGLPSAAPRHPREFERLVSLCGLVVSDRGMAATLDGIAREAADLCGAPFGLVTLVGDHDQIFVGNSGVSGTGTLRDEAICAHTILQDEPFVVEDLTADPRFAELPAATAAPHIRFYAGAPFNDRSGLPLGSVCVLDTKPRSLDSRSLLALARMATMAGVVLEARRFAVELLGPNSQARAVEKAFAELDRILAPLVASKREFRPTLL